MACAPTNRNIAWQVHQMQKHCMACPLNRNTAWHVHQKETWHGMSIKQKPCMACPPNRNIAWTWLMAGILLDIDPLDCNLLFRKKNVKNILGEDSWECKLQEIFFSTSPRNITFGKHRNFPDFLNIFKKKRKLEENKDFFYFLYK
jgi:hypothetical protein